MKPLLALFIFLLSGTIAVAGNSAVSHIASVDSMLTGGLLDSKKFPADISRYSQVKGYYHNHKLILITTLTRTGAESIECRYYIKDFSLVGVTESVFPLSLAKMNQETHYDAKGNYDFGYYQKSILRTRITYGEEITIRMEQFGKNIRLSRKQKTEVPETFNENYRTLVHSVALTLK